MSSVAIANLNGMWSDIRLLEVKRISATGRAGLTSDGQIFDIRSNRQLNFEFNGQEPLVFTDRLFGQPMPKVDDVICGTIDPAKNDRLSNWFVPNKSLLALHCMVMEGTAGSRLYWKQTRRHLTEHATDDMYLALVHLVFWNDVQSFVKFAKMNQVFVERRHQGLGSIWEGPRLSVNFAQFVHELSFALEEPRWWKSFLYEAKKQDVAHSHPAFDEACYACKQLNSNWYRDYQRGRWPYQNGPAT